MEGDAKIMQMICASGFEVKMNRPESKREVVQSLLAGEGGAKLLARRWSAEEKIRT